MDFENSRDSFEFLFDFDYLLDNFYFYQFFSISFAILL